MGSKIDPAKLDELMECAKVPLRLRKKLQKANDLLATSGSEAVECEALAAEALKSESSPKGHGAPPRTVKDYY